MCSNGLCPFRRPQASNATDAACSTCINSKAMWPSARMQTVPCPIQKSLPLTTGPYQKAPISPRQWFPVGGYRPMSPTPQSSTMQRMMPKLAEGRPNQGWPMQGWPTQGWPMQGAMAYSYFSHYTPTLNAKEVEPPCDFGEANLDTKDEEQEAKKLQWVGQESEPILVTCHKPKAVSTMPQFEQGSPYAVELGLLNPKGWYQNYETPKQHPAYTTSNSSYGALAPNVHTMSTTYYPMDHSFTEANYNAGMFRDHSLNSGPEPCETCPPDDKKLFP